MSVQDIDIRPFPEKISSCSLDGRITVHKKGRSKKSISISTNCKLFCIKFTSDGVKILSGGEDGNVKMIDMLILGSDRREKEPREKKEHNFGKFILNTVLEMEFKPKKKIKKIKDGSR